MTSARSYEDLFSLMYGNIFREKVKKILFWMKKFAALDNFSDLCEIFEPRYDICSFRKAVQD